MTTYRFHWWPLGEKARLTPGMDVEAQSPRHGAALALQRFVESGCDIGAPGAHLDVTDPDGSKRTVLVEEVLDWLNDDEQAAFVRSHGLAPLLQE
jgi:hypothetical protein